MKRRGYFICVLSFIICVVYLFQTKALAKEIKINEIKGKDIVETNINAIRSVWKTSDRIILINENNWVDSISCVSLSKKYDCPILFINRNEIRDDEKQLIKDLKVKEAIIIGNNDSIDNRVDEMLTEIGVSNKRMIGKDRYDTCVKIAKECGEPKFVAIVPNDNFIDGLTIAPYASLKKGITLMYPSGNNECMKKYCDDLKYAETGIYYGSIKKDQDQTGNSFNNLKFREMLDGFSIERNHEGMSANFIKYNGHIFSPKNIQIVQSDNFNNIVINSVMCVKNGNMPIIVSKNNIKDVREILTCNYDKIESITYIGNIENELKNNLNIDSNDIDAFVNNKIGIKTAIKEKLELNKVYKIDEVEFTFFKESKDMVKCNVINTDPKYKSSCYIYKVDRNMDISNFACNLDNNKCENYITIDNYLKQILVVNGTKSIKFDVTDFKIK